MSKTEKSPEKKRAADLKLGQRVALTASFFTLGLAVMKGLIGQLFGSEVLVADAFHSGADLLAIFASGFGLWLASKHKSAKFPYGLYKAETFISFLIGVGIMWAGFEILLDGYRKLRIAISPAGFPVMPVSASIVSLNASFFIARREKKVGRQINSQSLMINASESFLDIIVSGVVLVGILLHYARIPYVEGTVIMAISLLIFKLGLTSIWTSFLALMDANLDPKLQSEIEEKVNEIYGVKGVGDIRIRQAGPFKMVECKIETSATLPLYRAHELADQVEDFIVNSYSHIESVFIHVEPAKDEVVSAIIPVKDINGMDSRVHGHFGRAPYFVILKIGEGKTRIEDFYSNSFLGESQHVGIRVIKAIIKYKLDILFTSKVGELSFYMLKNNFVDIYRIEEGIAVREALQRYKTGELQKISQPTHLLEESHSGEE